MKGSYSAEYSQGMVAVSVLSVSFLWVSMWFLWPSVEKPVKQEGFVAFPVAYIQIGGKGNLKDYATDFVPNDQIKNIFDTKGTKDRLGEMLNQREKSEKFLNKDVFEYGDVLDAEYPSLPGQAERNLNTYRPRFREQKAVMVNEAVAGIRLNIEVSGGLKNYGFQVPHIALQSLVASDFPVSWQVVLHVDVDEAGRASHVFLKSGCENAVINDRILKEVWKGRLRGEVNACSGEVTVSFSDARQNASIGSKDL